MMADANLPEVVRLPGGSEFSTRVERYLSDEWHDREFCTHEIYDCDEEYILQFEYVDEDEYELTVYWGELRYYDEDGNVSDNVLEQACASGSLQHVCEVAGAYTQHSGL